jgi:DNA polymerase I
MESFEFVPVDYDYFDRDGLNYVRMIGRNGDGKKVCVVDSYEANFYLVLEEGANEAEILKKVFGVFVEKGSRVSKVLRTEVLDKKYLGKSVRAVRVFVSNHKDAHDLASEIGDLKGVFKRREYDVPLVTKYIKEKGVEPLKRYKVEAEKMGEFGDLDCFSLESAEEIEGDFVPKVLAYDIETDSVKIGEGEILMVSVFGEDVSKVFTWKKSSLSEDYVEFCDDEEDMIEKFVSFVKDCDPDILTGYFSDGFDLPYLKARASKLKVGFNLGVDNRAPVFSRGRIPSGKISGIVHVDLYRFIDAVFSQYLQGESLSLNEVAKELVGEEKEDFDFARLSDMKDEDWRDFYSYNLQDAVVTRKLFDKIWPDILEFSRIVREPVFDITRDRMATHVENHILHNLDRFDEIAEKRSGHTEIGERRARRRFEGANVFEPTPGFYEDIVMFDFTSMHASLIVSFNISGQSLRYTDCNGCHVAPEFEIDGKKTQVYFEKEAGFFSTLLSEVVEKRKKYKKEYFEDKNSMKKARSNAYKLLANATFGYQGFFGARYYSYEAAAATLAYVRKFTDDTIDTIRNAGHKIIYSDTDSIAFLQASKSREEILKFLDDINEKLPGIMELDLEDFYSRGLFVLKRGGVGGAKKKYALRDSEGNIKIRGFETVRRDWCKLTRDLQSDVLKRILEDGDEKEALKILKGVVGDLKKGKVDIENLMIKTQLRRPLGEYVAEGPHVVAAKKMVAKGIPVSTGMIVRYFIGEGVGKRIGDRVYLEGENSKYDVNYYLKNQVLPAVENIFEVFDVDVNSVLEGSEQKKLF